MIDWLVGDCNFALLIKVNEFKTMIQVWNRGWLEFYSYSKNKYDSDVIIKWVGRTRPVLAMGPDDGP